MQRANTVRPYEDCPTKFRFIGRDGLDHAAASRPLSYRPKTDRHLEEVAVEQYRKLSAHQLRQAARDGEAEAGAAVRAG